MLVYNAGAPSPSSTATPLRVTGQWLARAHLSREQRARLAARLSNGTAEIYPLTVGQAAAIARVSVLDVTRRRGRTGKRRNGHANGHETLADHIRRSSPAERLDAARVVGPEELWQTMVCPAAEEERTATESNT